jgi:hypothetical protein
MSGCIRIWLIARLMTTKQHLGDFRGGPLRPRRAADASTSRRQAECALRGPRYRDNETAEHAALAELAKANSMRIERGPAISTAADPGAHMIGGLLQSFGITEHHV